MGETVMIKSLVMIPPCAKFRYFEVEVSENKADSAIYVGLVEANDYFKHTPNSIESFSG